MLRRSSAVLAVLLAFAAASARAQDSTSVRVSIDDRGLVFSAPGKATEVALRFYLQPTLTLQTDGDGSSPRRLTMQIRHARLALNGTVFDPRLRVNFQLAFARSELDFETAGIINAVGDANVSWYWTPNLWTMFGQAKLFGNRQGINSVSELEFPDRSIVYSTFGPDRDAGVIAGYTRSLGKGPLILRGSITSGEGRNSTTGDAHLAYMARVDWMPLGAFIGNNAFSESDLKREPRGRIAVGAGFSYNEQATRVSGQGGAQLFSPRDIRTQYVDAIWKRRGVSIGAEFARRDAHDPITTRTGSDSRAVFVGYGVTTQASYSLRNGFTPAVRVSSVIPDEAIYGAPTAIRRTQTAVDVSRYLRAHKVKWQFELGRDQLRDPVAGTRSSQMYAKWTVLAGL